MLAVRRVSMPPTTYASLPCTTTELDNMIYAFTLQKSNTPSIEMPIKIEDKRGVQVKLQALIDSGATGNLINRKTLNRTDLEYFKLPRIATLRNADSRESKIFSYVHVKIIMEDHKGNKHEEYQKLFVADIGDNDMILGTDWLTEHNPEIDGRTHQVGFTRCPDTC